MQKVIWYIYIYIYTHCVLIMGPVNSDTTSVIPLCLLSLVFKCHVWTCYSTCCLQRKMSCNENVQCLSPSLQKDKCWITVKMTRQQHFNMKTPPGPRSVDQTLQIEMWRIEPPRTPCSTFSERRVCSTCISIVRFHDGSFWTHPMSTLCFVKGTDV